MHSMFWLKEIWSIWEWCMCVLQKSQVITNSDVIIYWLRYYFNVLSVCVCVCVCVCFIIVNSMLKCAYYVCKYRKCYAFLFSYHFQRVFNVFFATTLHFLFVIFCNFTRISFKKHHRFWEDIVFLYGLRGALWFVVIYALVYLYL